MKFKIQKYRFLMILLILPFSAFSQKSAGHDIVLSGKLQVYIHPDESPQVGSALKDLLRDLHSVLGQPASVVTELPESGPVIVIATGKRYEGSHPSVSGWEAHQLYVDQSRIILNGSDIRGTIYAIYTFSEEILGVKPLWFWTAEKPVRKDKIIMKANYSRRIGSPYLKYRSWLPNDTDLLSPWQKRSAENYEAYFETMLRLKLNTLEGVMADRQSFKAPYPAGKDAGIAQKRGLIATGHHLNIFGSSYANWADYWKEVRHMPVPPLTIANRQGLREYWGYHIDLAKRNHLEVIWLVGFRGNRDIPFWEFFPDAPAGQAARAKVIEEMVRMQIDLLKEKTNNPHPPMRLTLYNEMSNLLADGLLKLPDEPSLILNFVAARRDHFPALDLRNHQFSGEQTGYYMNFQFTSTGSHLAQAEGPHKMEQNFRMVDSLSAQKFVFSVVNAGNMREHLLELSANAALLWNFKTFNASNFLRTFSTTYFGDRYGPEIAQLYEDYFNSYWQQKANDLPGFDRQYIFQDLRYVRAAEMLLNDMETGTYRPDPLENHPLDNASKGSTGYFRVVPADNGAANQLEALLKGTDSSILKLTRINKKTDDLYLKLQEGKSFFNDNLRGQAKIMLNLNLSLNHLVKAYQHKQSKAVQEQFIQKSLDHVRFVQQCLREAEHPPFQDWYAKETKSGLNSLIQRLQLLSSKLKSEMNKQSVIEKK